MEDLARLVDDEFSERIAAHPGFVSYEFIDCGEGEIMTATVFRDDDGAWASRDMAKRWSEERLAGFEFTQLEPFHGEILVSRASRDLLQPGHVGDREKFASVRCSRLEKGSLGDLMHLLDAVLIDQFAEIDGFEAYHALDCGAGNLVTISMFRDEAGIAEAKRRARQFAEDYLGDFQIERVEWIHGKVLVTRAKAELLQPAHA